MAYATVPTAVTGDIVPAAWGNRVRDNSAYLKGQAGAVAIENAMTIAGTLNTTGVVTAAGVLATGAGAALSVNDRTTSQGWTWYASGGSAFLFNNTLGNLFGFEYGTGNGGAAAHAGLWPSMLSQSALTGFLRGGQWTYAYNGDGTIASQVMNAAGPLSGWALTYEYSGGLVAAMRLRIGGAGGTVVQSIGYTYDGTGRIATETHS